MATSKNRFSLGTAQTNLGPSTLKMIEIAILVHSPKFP